MTKKYFLLFLVLGLLLACQKNQPLFKFEYKKEINLDRSNLSDKLFYYWDPNEEANIRQSVGFLLDKIKDQNGQYLNDDYPVHYTVKNESGDILQEKEKEIAFITVDSAAAYQGTGVLRIKFTDFLELNEGGYFEVSIEVKDKGQVLASTQTFIFVLEDKSKLNMKAQWLGKNQKGKNRLIVTVAPPYNSINQMYYKIGNAPVQSQRVYIDPFTHRAVIYDPIFLPEDANDPYLRTYVWSLTGNQANFAIHTLEKDFCDVPNIKDSLIQKYHLKDYVFYKKIDKRDSPTYQITNKNVEKKNENKVYKLFKTTYSFNFEDKDLFKEQMQQGFKEENGRLRIGFNYKYNKHKIAILPQELICMADQIQTLNFNFQDFNDLSIHPSDFGLFKQLDTLKFFKVQLNPDLLNEIKKYSRAPLILEEDKDEVPYHKNGSCWMAFFITETKMGAHYFAVMLWDNNETTGTPYDKPHNNTCPFSYTGSSSEKPKIFSPPSLP